MKKQRDNISKVLLELGIPANLKGFRYLKEAILRTTDIKNFSTMLLYKDISKVFNVSESIVERAIRTAIDVAFLRCDSETITRFFGNSICADKGKPTNSQFIKTVAECMK